MERTKDKIRGFHADQMITDLPPTAILCSDFHLREDVPICRTDSYWDVQWKKVDFIKELQIKYTCPVLHGGDLFDHWKPSPNLLRETILHLPKQFHTCYGQHDLPSHSLQLVDKCGINVLEVAKKLTVLSECHWNEVPKEGSMYFPNYDCRILVWHKMTYQAKKPWPNCTDPMATKILIQHPFPLILTGDNHKTFVEEYKGRLLVNPGSLMRMDADQIEHKPCVFLWFAEDNSIQQIFIPIEDNVISREHLERKEERDGRIEAFVSRLDTEWEAAVSFEQNLEIFEKTNQVRKSVMEIVFNAIES